MVAERREDEKFWSDRGEKRRALLWILAPEGYQPNLDGVALDEALNANLAAALVSAHASCNARLAFGC
jgi:hypothetical protein